MKTRSNRILSVHFECLASFLHGFWEGVFCFKKNGILALILFFLLMGRAGATWADPMGEDKEAPLEEASWEEASWEEASWEEASWEDASREDASWEDASWEEEDPSSEENDPSWENLMEDVSLQEEGSEPEDTEESEELHENLQEAEPMQEADGAVAILVTPEWEETYFSFEEAWNEAVFAASEYESIRMILQEDWVSSEAGSFGRGAGFSIEGSILLDVADSEVNLEANGHVIQRQGEAASGGCVFCIFDGTLVIWDAQIRGGNSTTDGGGALVLGGILDLENVLLTENQAENGGGLCVTGGEAYLCDCQIVRNRAHSLGGGIYLDAEEAELFFFEEVLIEGNVSQEEPDFVRDCETGEVTSTALEPSRQVESEFLEEGCPEEGLEEAALEAEEADETEEVTNTALEPSPQAETKASEEEIEGLPEEFWESSQEEALEASEDSIFEASSSEEPDFVRDCEAGEVTKSATEPGRQVETKFLKEEQAVGERMEAWEISGAIQWENEVNGKDDRPKSVSIRLLSDGIITQVQEVSEDAKGEWNYCFRNLPRYRQNSETKEEGEGEEILYSITMDAIDGYTTRIEGDEIINTYISKEQPQEVYLSGSIQWEDQENASGKRPNQVVVNLFGGNTLLGQILVKANSNGSWSFHFGTIGTRGDSQEALSYSVTEDALEDYTAVIETTVQESKSQGLVYHVTITNTLSMAIGEGQEDAATLLITGEILWKDEEDKSQVRPEEVIVRLMQGDDLAAETVVKPNQEGRWLYSLEGVPLYRQEEELHLSYALTPEDVKDYTWSLSIGRQEINEEVLEVDTRITEVWNALLEENPPTITMAPTPMITMAPTPTITMAPTPTITLTPSPTETVAPTATLTPAVTVTVTPTATPKPTHTPKPTSTPTQTATPTPTKKGSSSSSHSSSSSDDDDDDDSSSSSSSGSSKSSSSSGSSKSSSSSGSSKSSSSSGSSKSSSSSGSSKSSSSSDSSKSSSSSSGKSSSSSTEASVTHSASRSSSSSTRTAESIQTGDPSKPAFFLGLLALSLLGILYTLLSRRR